MLCDTVEQLETILSAQVAGGIAAGQQAYQALLTTPNAKQEPSCLVATYSVTVLDVASVVEGVPTTDGGTATMYILYVVVGDTPYAILSPVPVGPREFDV